VIGVSFDDIAPLATLARVRCPTLLVHGRADATVPVDDAQRLLAVCGHARLLLVDGDHDLRDALGPHAQALVGFLRAACAPPADRAGEARAASHALLPSHIARPNPTCG
jgi:fermentation-respiration switch protein FrsA (DUF1100 family)